MSNLPAASFGFVLIFTEIDAVIIFGLFGNFKEQLNMINIINKIDIIRKDKGRLRQIGRPWNIKL